MGKNSAIQWTGDTWNPIAAFDRETGKRGWFCQKVSPGCTHCYAEALNKWVGTGHGYRVPDLEKIEFRLMEEGDAAVTAPLRWTEGRLIFPCSMTDMFGEWVPEEWLVRIFAVMALTPQHTYQVLTKRPERAAVFLGGMRDLDVAAEADRISPGFKGRWPGWPLPNVWIGTSVEDQERADERLPHLLRCPAAIRFLSCEPLLGRLDIWWDLAMHNPHDGTEHTVDWVIVGGESGSEARPMKLDWARQIISDCQDAEVAVFMKQLGARPRDNGSLPVLHDKKGGDMEEWPEDLRVREMPE